MTTTHKATVLIIEDEPLIRKFLRISLEAAGLKVAEADTAALAIASAERFRPDLYIIDLGLPDMDGIQLIHSLRTWTRNPIIVVTARSQETEKVRALDAGADDYLTKPFGIDELKARIRVALRHLVTPEQPGGSPIFRFGPVTIDLAARRITRGQSEIRLTPTEFKLLALLGKYPGKVVTQRTLLTEVWGPAYESETHYLRVYMKQLREKLEENPSMPQHLITETGVGYRLVADAEN